MQKEIAVTVWPQEAANKALYSKLIAKKAGIKSSDITDFKLIRRSIDARSQNVKVVLKFCVGIGEKLTTKKIDFTPCNVANAPEIAITGAGPAGLFAALRLLEFGLKPVIFERGKDVKSRKKDISAINSNRSFNPESNYAFGEGGAGTFSDGKLNTRSKKRGNIRRIPELLVYHGANQNILIDANPHIGTNKLPELIKNIRQTILNSGGEIHFNTKITGFEIKNSQITGIKLPNGSGFKCEYLILATGNSAYDIFQLCLDNKIAIESKPFAAGVRVEHPQPVIDQIQYGKQSNSIYLPTANYSLTAQNNGRGIYSFCMCPGGFIVPSLTNEKQLVVNGMSATKRNSPFANSGIVVELGINDFHQFKSYGALAGLKFQQQLEKTAFLNGGNGMIAPAQRLTDFLDNKLSPDLPPCSYPPGVISSPMHFWLPDLISKNLQYGFKQFEKKMRGFITREAIVVGLESRTSSPVRILRDEQQLQHIQIKGLYPCGEGAGYAGGIVSSALDGMRCAEAIAEKIFSK